MPRILLILDFPWSIRNLFNWKLCKSHCWVLKANELSQQVKTWPSGPFIFLSSASWKACSLEIHPNNHGESRGPTLCPVHWTVLCNMEIVPIPIPDSQTLGNQVQKQNASVKHKHFVRTVTICEWNYFGDTNKLGFFKI